MDRDAPAKGKSKDSYHHGELREALIRATRKLVEERGAEHFTLADACRVAGVTTAAPYRHFSGKEELFALTLESYLEELRDALAAASDKGREPRAKLGAIVGAFVERPITSMVERSITGSNRSPIDGTPSVPGKPAP